MSAAENNNQQVSNVYGENDVLQVAQRRICTYSHRTARVPVTRVVDVVWVFFFFFFLRVISTHHSVTKMMQMA